MRGPLRESLRAIAASLEEARHSCGAWPQVVGYPGGAAGRESVAVDLAFGQHEDRTLTHGYAATREAAMAAFAKSWRRE